MRPILTAILAAGFNTLALISLLHACPVIGYGALAAAIALVVLAGYFLITDP